jgi:DnaJ-class molecular chaperone
MSKIDIELAEALTQIAEAFADGWTPPVPETRTCKWCKGYGKVMKTITPGLEMSVPCEDCDGKGTWEIEE